uniref:C3H1-type domain-containing protein n=1 Tax=Leptocylindrus danicus TaxID=163516 RepID=A0A7S2L9S3_9STRA|mmetsp:Transcript_33831/g.48990  ORF Transcript_33831/g.48990 Transcript_33831/m.48990 type:complete len:540 (+) Transcript_33831:114-1733(+)
MSPNTNSTTLQQQLPQAVPSPSTKSDERRDNNDNDNDEQIVLLNTSTSTACISKLAERLQFFLSDSNLRNDRWLRSRLDETKCFVRASDLLSCNSIRKISTSEDMLVRAADHLMMRIRRVHHNSNNNNNDDDDEVQIGRTRPFDMTKSGRNIDVAMVLQLERVPHEHEHAAPPTVVSAQDLVHDLNAKLLLLGNHHTNGNVNGKAVYAKWSKQQQQRRRRTAIIEFERTADRELALNLIQHTNKNVIIEGHYRVVTVQRMGAWLDSVRSLRRQPEQPRGGEYGRDYRYGRTYNHNISSNSSINKRSHTSYYENDNCNKRQRFFFRGSGGSYGPTAPAPAPTTTRSRSRSSGTSNHNATNNGGNSSRNRTVPFPPPPPSSSFSFGDARQRGSMLLPVNKKKKNGVKKIMCKYFSGVEGCRWGENCRFEHSYSSSSAASVGTTAAAAQKMHPTKTDVAAVAKKKKEKMQPVNASCDSVDTNSQPKRSSWDILSINRSRLIMLSAVGAAYGLKEFAAVDSFQSLVGCFVIAMIVSDTLERNR